MTPTSMQAAVFAGPGSLAIEARAVPKVSHPDDVLVRIDACGFCGSDLQILAVPPGHPAKLGVILGHEISGRVVDHGSAVTFGAGQVVVDPDIKCGICRACRQGRPGICLAMVSMGVDADGGFAGYCVVPARNVYTISDAVSPSIAAMTEPLSNVLNGVSRIEPQIGESAVIFGAGPIGAMFLLCLRQAGVNPIWMIEPSASRSDMAVKLGAQGASASSDLYADAVKRGEAGQPDIVVDAVGRCLGDGLEIVGAGGRILLFGINHTAEATVSQSEITMREISILGSVTSRFTIPYAIRAIEDRVVDMDKLGIHEMGLAQISEAVNLLRSGGIMKAVIRPEL